MRDLLVTKIKHNLLLDIYEIHFYGDFALDYCTYHPFLVLDPKHENFKSMLDFIKSKTAYTVVFKIQYNSKLKNHLIIQSVRRPDVHSNNIIIKDLLKPDDVNSSKQYRQIVWNESELKSTRVLINLDKYNVSISDNINIEYIKADYKDYYRVTNVTLLDNDLETDGLLAKG